MCQATGVGKRSNLEGWFRPAALLVLLTAAVGSAAEAQPRADLYGDPLPRDAIARLGTVRFRHIGAVTFVALTPDGRSLLTGGQDNTVRLWDLHTGKEMHRFGKERPDDTAENVALGLPGQAVIVPIGGRNQRIAIGLTVAVSQDGRLVAANTTGQPVRVWELGSGKEVCTIESPPSGISALQLSPDGNTLVGRDSAQTLHFWEVKTGKTIRELNGDLPNQPANVRPPLIVNRIASRTTPVFSPDGKMLAVVETTFDNRVLKNFVKLLEVETGKEIRRVPQDQQIATGIAFSADSKVLAHTNSRSVRLTEIDTGKEILKIDVPQAGIEAIAIAPDGKMLAVREPTIPAVRLYDTQTGNFVRQLGEGEAVPVANPGVARSPNVTPGRGIAFSKDGKLLATGGASSAYVWEVASGKEIVQDHGHRGAVTDLAVSPDGKLVASRGADQIVRLWERMTGKQLNAFHAPAGTNCMAFAPGGRTAALGNVDGTVRVHDVVSGKELHKLTGPRNFVFSVAFAPDGKTLAVRGGNTIRIHDVAAGREVRTISMFPANSVLGPGGVVVLRNGGLFRAAPWLAFSPDGKTVVSTPGVLSQWDVTTGKEILRVPLSGSVVGLSYAFAPDGRTVAVENADQQITLLEVAGGKQRAHFDGDTVSDPIPNLPNGTMVRGATVTATAAQTVAFTPDGRFVAVQGPDHTVRVCDIAAEKVIGHFKGHDGSITAVAVAADGKFLVSGSRDSTILVWDLARLSPVTPQPLELTAEDATVRWNTLASEDGAAAWKAVRKLARAPKQAVPLLREHLKPAIAVDPKKVTQWVADLDSNKFSVRQEAMRELEKVGEQAMPALADVVTGQHDLEGQRRAELLLNNLTGHRFSPEQLRTVRAIEVLERIGSPEARQVLTALAEGAPGVLQTREAQSTLVRLSVQR